MSDTMLVRWCVRRPERALAAGVGLVAAAGLVLRLVELGERPLHHDESIDAWFSWKFLEGTFDGYDPIYHGPLRFYITSVVFWLFGESHTTARLLAVVSGTLLILVPWLLRHRLGPVATLGAAAVLAFAPGFVYFSRFGREDAPVVLLTMVMAVVVVRFFDPVAGEGRWQPAGVGAGVSAGAPAGVAGWRYGALPVLFAFLLAASFAIKETTFITLFVFGSFLLALLAEQAAQQRGLRTRHAWMLPAGLLPMAAAFVAASRFEVFLTLGVYGLLMLAAGLVLFGRGPLSRLRELAVLAPLRAVRPWVWLLAVAVLALFFALWFTVLFTRPGDLLSGITDGISYWRDEQATNRGGEPWHYYLYVVPLYEYLTLALALIGVVHVFRNPTFLGKFLVWTTVASWLSYSWASERFPWLVLHLLVPMSILAGLGVRVLWQARHRVWTRPAGVVLVGLLAATLVTTFTLNYQRQRDPRELYTQVHTTEEYLDVVRRIEAVNEHAVASGRPPVSVAIDSAISVPNLWYFRDYPELRWVNSDTGIGDALPDYVLYAATSSGLAEDLDGYQLTRLPLRDWWAPQFDSYNDGWSDWGWANWLIDREVWNPDRLGSFDIQLAVSPRAAILESQLPS